MQSAIRMHEQHIWTIHHNHNKGTTVRHAICSMHFPSSLSSAAALMLMVPQSIQGGTFASHNYEGILSVNLLYTKAARLLERDEILYSLCPISLSLITIIAVSKASKHANPYGFNSGSVSNDHVSFTLFLLTPFPYSLAHYYYYCN